VEFIWQFAPHLVAMAVLLGLSAFFSCSEAALFYLPLRDRREMESGRGAQRVAVQLLANPDRLLTAVLFCNLLVNVAYFTVASLISLSLERQGEATEAGVFAAGSLLTLIVLSEMLPKSIGVLLARPMAIVLGVPLSLAVRLIDPILPALFSANTVARRVIFPRLKAEPYLEVDDLEQAVALSTPDPSVLMQEQAALQNIVSLSELHVEELMRPRTQYLAFRPPVRLTDLQGKMTPSGHLLVTEPDSDEIAAAIFLRNLSELPAEHLEHYAEPVIYVPWSATVATTLEEMRRLDREVAAVINEFGETIGIVTLDDILDTLFHEQSSRSARLLARSSIAPHGDGKWHVTGMTGLRRIGKHFSLDLPPTKSVTVGGILQELLQRVPVAGDEVEWAGLRLRVLDASEYGSRLVELSIAEPREEKP
jgi:CBS domain containing-hemolysin-like protein